MPRQPQLATVPLTALVQELNSRFAELEKAKKQLLADGLRRVSVGDESGRRHLIRERKKRGGTSAYSQKVSSLNQSIRHATTRIKKKRALPDDQRNIVKWQKELTKLQKTHKGR